MANKAESMTSRSLAALCLVVAVAPMTSYAQRARSTDASTEAGAAGLLEEVTVTAERVTSTVQTTPVAITAVNAETLAERQITNVLTAADEIPGVMITPTQGSNTNARISLRGAVQNTGGINFDPSVGIYIDNVYQPRITGAFFDFFDIDRMEVLRGPQGTLYGRNSSGGALKIQTKRPSFSWTGAGELSGGNWDAVGAKAWISGPIIDDKLALSVSAVKRERDGFIYGTEYGRRIGNIDSRAERVKVLYTPTDKLDVELSVFAIQDYSEGGVPVPLQVLPGINMPEANGTFNRDYSYTGNYGPSGGNSINNSGSALNVRYTLSDFISLGSITGYGNLRTYSAGGISFVTLAQQAAKEAGEDITASSPDEGTSRDEFYSQELNLTYSGERLKGVLGVYYFDEKGGSRAVASGSPTTDQDRHTKASAGFVQGTYTIGGGVGLTAGIRYTREEANFTQFFRTQLNVAQSASKTFTSTTPKFGINWQATPNLLTYGSWTKGFKSGGFNPIPPNANTGVPGAIGAPTPYDPEEVESLEVGLKYTTLDRRFRLNVAAYRAEYDGLQLPVFFPGTGTIYTSNATGGVVEGIEIEPTWQPLESLQFYGNASFTDGKYTGSFICSNQFGQFMDCRDRDLSTLIPTKAMVGIRYMPSLRIPGQLRFNGSWNYHDQYFNNVANEGPLVATPEASIYNAGIGWTGPAEHWSVTLDVRNVTDKHYSQAGLQRSNPIRPAVNSYPNNPREVMLRVGVSF